MILEPAEKIAHTCLTTAIVSYLHHIYMYIQHIKFQLCYNSQLGSFFLEIPVYNYLRWN